MSRHGTEATPLRHDRIETRSFLTTVMERSALRYDREFELDISAAPATFGADSARIEQVMSILLSNAVRHSGTDGTIRILAEAEDDGIRLSVQDRGRGLDRDELLSIFDSCERSNDEPDRRPGLGLGLFVSRKIIERHGGRLWAESAGRGHGARVSFWLPASSPATSLDGVDPASGQDRDVRIA
jgi:signal transduction histidine kinase